MERCAVQAFPTTTDPNDWHRYFAIEANNRAWLLVGRSRSQGEDEEMLDNAHASLLHWSEAGTELNRQRALMLLAHVHALAGFGASALAYAKEMRAYFLGRETEDWEIAFVHTVYAHAAHAAGDTDRHKIAHDHARWAIAEIADPEDRHIVQETFDRVPEP
jgi:hypothetical protein